MNVQIEPGWMVALQAEFAKGYFVELMNTVTKEYSEKTVFPLDKDIFTAFNACPYHSLKVVILGQDPYHGDRQAQGLAFSVPEDVAIPPSLKNIFKEIQSDVNGAMPHSGNLMHWSQQGVLLLNSTLTVEKGVPGSHQGLGWERFTDAVIKKISEDTQHIVFLLWGNFAISKRSLIDENKHLVLTAPHPSPLSAYRGFFSCKHFNQTNKYLKENNLPEIIW